MSELETNPDASLLSEGQAAGAETLSETTTAAQEPKPAELPPGTPGRVVPLKHPYTSRDVTRTSVTFSRRPIAKDLVQGAGANPAEQELYGIAALLGEIPEDLMRMDGADYLRVQQEWAAFLTS